tara:strand:- start:178 stop:801 length:624 start_codon:yes stop_codon:yes gene_type:complete
MAGTFPTTILPRSFQVINNRPTLINQSVSGKRVTRKYGSQYWTLEVGLPPLNKNDGLGVYGFLQQQQGSFEKFNFKHPERNRGNAGTSLSAITAKVKTAHSAGDSTIDIDTFNAFGTGGDLLKRGDIIQFANHDKVYMIKSDVTMPSSASDTKELSIEPPLITSLANNESVTLDQPTYSVYLTGDVGYTTDASGLYYYNFSLRECIE